MQSHHDAVTLYSGRDGKAIRTFKTGPVECIDITSDDRLAAVGCSDGSVTVADIKKGGVIWSKAGSQTGLAFVWDVCFAGDGTSMVACAYRGQPKVFETRSGKQIASVQIDVAETSGMAAALCPDGKQGMLIEMGGRMLRFDLPSGKITDTGYTGAAPIRYSSDGKYVAFSSNNSGVATQLSILNSEGISQPRLVGHFAEIGRIRATPQGFQVTGVTGESSHEALGVTCDPTSGSIRTIWQTTNTRMVHHDCGIMDFNVNTMEGVCTNYRLVTRLIDLRTNTTRISADNSADYRPSVVSYSSRGRRTMAVWLIAGAAGLGVVVAIVVGLLLWHRRANQQ